MQVPFVRALVVTTLLSLPAAGWSQTITFDSIPNQIFGVSPFTIAAQASSGLPVDFTSTTPAVCKLAADLVMLLRAGTCSITADSSGTASVTRSFTVSLAKPSGSFRAAAGSPFAVGAGPESTVVGDFNRDGKPDLAVANFDDGTVTVLLGNGAGGFTAARGSPFTVGSFPLSVAVGDFNGDGIQDLATANEGSGDVTVLLGNGAGGFTAVAGGPFTVGSFPASVVVGDFNGDGIQDIATANLNSNDVTVLLGNGAGEFTAATGGPFAVGVNPDSLVAGDFNGDGNQDLAIANNGGNNVTVLLGNGAGGFKVAPSSPFAVGTGPYAVVLGDFNGDGIQDLATVDYFSGTVTVLLGNGAGGFTAAGYGPFNVERFPVSLVVGDFNGDGIQDLATENGSSDNVTVLLGDGSGGFIPSTGSPYAVGAYPESVAVGDFNGDGILDLVTPNSGDNSVTVLLGLLVGKTSQSILIGPLADVTYGVPPFTIGAVASSGLPLSFASTTSGVCTVAGNTVTVVTGGVCSIIASQAGDATYAAAATVTEVFTVNPASQTITFGLLSNQILGSGSPSLNATASSNLTVGFYANTTAVCTVSGTNITLVAVGTCSVTAYQLGTFSYTAAPSITQTFTVSAPSLQLLTVEPCRVMDTRNENSLLGGPFIAAGTSRSIAIPSSACGIPFNAVAYSLNITVVPRTGTLGYLTVWPTGQSQPVVSTLNSPAGLALANAAIVPAGDGGSINAFATDDTDLVVDINGYFVPPATSTFQFYPLPPCRVVDTRNPDGVFGGPSLGGGDSRSFPIPSSSCGVPEDAAAYSFNVTVVPQGQLGYLTAWPTGQAQPVVSTLNSLNGAVLANAAIVPAGTAGAANFYATDTTDLIVDINGYFAAPASGGLNFNTVTPCRLADTRNASGPLGGPVISSETMRTFPIAGSCGLPESAAVQAYALNVTVVPKNALGYLTTWPTGGTQPVVSTLNSPNGQVAANAAIVPAGTDGSINVFVTDTTDLVIDTSGYFAQ